MERPTDARELWVVRQCDVEQNYVVTLRRVAGGQDEIHVWPAGAASASGVVAPLPPVADITDAQARAEYDRVKAQLGDEYHVRHIMTAAQATAQAALDRLHAGEPFATVAAQVSIDNGSAAKGGDLGWAAPRTYVGPFAAEVRLLAPEGLAAQPVQTTFGWHVIEVLGVRPRPMPPFDGIKTKVIESLRGHVADGL